MSKKCIKFSSGMLDNSYYTIYIIPDEGINVARAEIHKDEGIKIYLGILGDFSELYESLIHELQEIYLMINDARYYNTNLPNEYNIFECIFMFNHTRLQLMCRYLSKILVEIQPNLYETWCEYNDIIEKEDEDESN